MSEIRLIRGDCLEQMASLPSGSVDAIVTSPPYWGLRDYGTDGQIGLEDTPAAYVARLVGVFEEARRVLRDDGTLWLNLGDSYNAHPGQRTVHDKHGRKQATNRGSNEAASRSTPELKAKDLCGIPWRVAFALQEAGWYLRSDIIWHKPNPMPESVTDRPTKAHEYIFLLAKSERYWYDADAIREPFADERLGSSGSRSLPYSNGAGRHDTLGNSSRKGLGVRPDNDGRNRRTVWTIPPSPYRGAHFATFPPDLIRPCVRAGCRPGGTVLDPFFGAGTTGVVCVQEGRDCIGIELNQEYLCLAQKRIADAQAQIMLTI